ncbi:hypothetical protein [Elizabethkingia anophelis]|uniref:hypothetical protein n=1 Tax=Elizabethkingia anophelis TaxID=1117645 RepID=UPI0020127CC5|nr:hypothetical protein [Elizabethkingia anophelis]MCL1689405.1 hypothetical protein [Elizabethkingia anophelis]
MEKENQEKKNYVSPVIVVDYIEMEEGITSGSARVFSDTSVGGGLYGVGRE